jgi:hypothetical protein
MKSKKYVLTEGMFNWLLNLLVGKNNNAKLRYYVKIKTDPKLRKLSKEFEKSAKELKREFDKRKSQPDYDKEYHDELNQILRGN